MDTDRNLLFGVLALQADLLTPARFVEACTLWANQKQTPLADLLVERGWLSDADRSDIQKLLARKLQKHQGDARAGLAEVTTDQVRQSLAEVADADVRQSLALPTPPLQGHVLLSTTDHLPEARDRYTLSRLHATGGIGRVWLARDDSLGRDVALKELRPERAGNPVVWGRFLREARVTGQLEHPGIVPIYAVGRRPEDQAPFYTMRFVRGRTLAEAVRGYHQKRSQGAAGPLELRELLTAFVGVCNAVAYAHSRGVLHRDLKPQNVVLGDYGEVIVLDWGLAKLVDQPEADDGLAPVEVAAEGDVKGTMQGQVLGTPAYMAPEQAEGRLDLLGQSTDTYGLGAILFEILTGKPPFTGPDSSALLRQVIHEMPPRPSAVAAGVPAALEAVCLKALAKKPVERYASAKDLAAEVQHFLAGEPVFAYREPWTVRAGRWVKRHRVLVTSAAAAGLVALVGLVLGLVLQARANSELLAANERERLRFELAMEAIKTFHSGVSEDVLLKQEQFKDLQKRLLGGAAEYYGKLEKLLADQTDPRSRRALGAAYHELGALTGKIGSKAEALRVQRQGLAVRRELAQDPGAEVEVRLDVARSLLAVGLLQQATGDPAGGLATCEEARALAEGLKDAASAADSARSVLALSHNIIGNLLRQTGRLGETLSAYQKALGLYQKLADANPAVTRFQSDLAWIHNNIGVVFYDTGKRNEALAAHRQALALRQKLADANPAVTRFQSDLANSHNNIGAVFLTTGKREEALAAYRQALGLRQKLAVANPAVTEFQSNLAISHNNIGVVFERTGKREEALAAHRQALGLRQKLADANPAVPEFQGDLAQSHSNIGYVLDKSGKFQEALAADQRALTIRQKLADANPTITQVQSDLARSLARLGVGLRRAGEPAAAATSLRRAIAVLQQLPSRTGANHYSLACYQSRLAGLAIGPGAVLTAAEGQIAADQAMTDLRRAITAGYTNLPLFRTDTDLEALRPRPDFQQLMKELEAKEKAKSP